MAKFSQHVRLGRGKEGQGGGGSRQVEGRERVGGPVGSPAREGCLEIGFGTYARSLLASDFTGTDPNSPIGAAGAYVLWMLHWPVPAQVRIGLTINYVLKQPLGQICYFPIVLLADR